MSCIICGTKRKGKRIFSSCDRMYGGVVPFPVVECSGCHSLRIVSGEKDRKQSELYPSENYYVYAQKRPDFFMRLRRFLIRVYYKPSVFGKVLLSIINTVPAIPKYREKGTILDIGCGTGETIGILSEYGWKTYGIDIDRKAIKEAGKRKSVTARVGSWKTIGSFPNHFFDCIRLYHVIEHIDDPAAFLTLAGKKMKKDGELIIGTPNGRSGLRFLFKSYWYNLDAPRHINIFSVSSLTDLLRRKGYEVMDMRFCSGGGTTGSIQYLLSSFFGRTIRFVSHPIAFLLGYPVDRLFDTIGIGDVFVVTARKKHS